MVAPHGSAGGGAGAPDISRSLRERAPPGHAAPALGTRRAARSLPLPVLVSHGGREDPEPQGRGSSSPGGAGGEHQRGPGPAGRAEDQLGA